jgi:hypothetical protein
MTAIIYQKTPGGLFATGERTVSTFPSGLVRVDQTFICPTSDAATHRAALAVGSDMPGGSAPAIDGLKIFPEPQEKKRDNGFTEFIVSAYGRTNTVGRTTFEWNTFSESGTLKLNIGTANERSYSVTAILRNKVKKAEKVILLSEVNTLVFDESGATTPVKIDGMYGNTGISYWSVGVTSYQSTQYGNFVEIIYIVDAYKLATTGE